MSSDAVADAIVIVAARRTPLGTFQGALADAQSPELAATAIRACVEDIGIDNDAIDEGVQPVPVGPKRKLSSAVPALLEFFK